MTGGLGVRSPETISNQEMNLGVMLLYIAYKYPEVVMEKKRIYCSEISFPGTIASKFADVPDTPKMVTLPAADFTRIVEKLMKAELVCRLTNKRGKVFKKTFPMLPVMLFDDANDPSVMFTQMPQCYFEEEEQDGKIVRQMKPTGDMLQFMLDHLEEQ